jgi:uncharacterized protein YhbP (UPF0306 family)
VEKKPEITSGNPVDRDTYRNRALVLLKNAKTMVLAVDGGDGPWAAPVYFLFASPGIYFFSSPRSKHAQALQRCSRAAGAIFADSDQWQDIHGLQMIGKVEQVQGTARRLSIATRYLVKFPQAGQVLAPGRSPLAELDTRVSLYVFWPYEIHCTDNRQGFGRRVSIQL